VDAVGLADAHQVGAEAAEAIREEIDPPSDIHADAKYRRQLAAVLTRRALTMAISRVT
jgi:carbon-monoxide dehydrogenase medium subunit